MPKTPIYLITGFLGSGKTTFLQHAIEYFEGSRKIAIVQNEFAPANFDGKEIKRSTNSTFDLLEINNGSVFCVCLLSGFIDSLLEFKVRYQPDLILMEASGLSDPVSIGQIFNSPKLKHNIYLAGTICITDANNFEKFDKLLPRIHHQLQIADIILINKTDLVENISDLVSKIEAINPFAQKYLTKYCQVPLAQIFLSPIKSDKKVFFVPGSSDRPDMQSVVFKSSKPIKWQYAESFIRQIAAHALRAKGYILLDNATVLSVQSIADEIHTQEITSVTKQTEIIAMGYDITISHIKSAYQSFQ